MRLRFVPLAAVAILSVLATGAGRAEAPSLSEAWNAPAIAWHGLKSGIREAARSGKTVMMVFHAPWCSACAKYRSVFKDERIVAASRNVVMILVDADADKIANGAFAPDGTYVPRTIFMTPDGDVRTDLVGRSDPKHPHTLDIENSGELLALLLRAGGERNETAPGLEQRAAN